MNKKSLVTLGIAGAMFLSVGAVAVTMFDQSTMRMFSSLGATEVNKTIILGQEHAPTQATTYQESVVYSEIEHATFTYTKVKAFDGALCAIDEGGTITKDTALGLTSFVSTFVGDLKLETKFEDDGKIYTYDLVSGESVALCGNYIKVIALEKTIINSLSLTYGCEQHAKEEEHTYSPLVTNEGFVGYSCQSCGHLLKEKTFYAYGDSSFSTNTPAGLSSTEYQYGMNNRKNVWIQWDVFSFAEQEVELFMLTCSRTTSLAVTGNIDVTLNGTAVDTTGVYYPVGKMWHDYKEVSLGLVTLKAGSNQIRFTHSLDVPTGNNFAAITFGNAEYGIIHGGIDFEVEDLDLTSHGIDTACLVTSANYTYLGSSWKFNGKNLEIPFYSSIEQTVYVTATFAAGQTGYTGEQTIDTYLKTKVNGKSVTLGAYYYGGGWEVFNTSAPVAINIVKGINVIDFNIFGSANANYDKFTIYVEDKNTIVTDFDFFQAEYLDLTGLTTTGAKTEAGGTGTVVCNFSTANSYMTFTVNSSEAKQVEVFMNINKGPNGGDAAGQAIDLDDRITFYNNNQVFFTGKTLTVQDNYSTYTQISFPLDLHEGENVIKVSYRRIAAPNFDYFAIIDTESYRARYEFEDLDFANWILSDNNSTKPIVETSNGNTHGCNMWAIKTNSYFEFSFTSEVLQDVTLGIRYNNKSTININVDSLIPVTLNGKSLTTGIVTETHTDYVKFSDAYCTFEVVPGINTIRFTKKTANFNIDFFDIIGTKSIVKLGK